MKKLSLSLFFLLFFTQITFSQNLDVPTLSPFTQIEQEVALTKVKLSYARPSAKGRKVFGGLVPFGKIWRTGANASTKLTFSEDVKIAGNDLKAGTYALYTIPNKEMWTMIIHKNTKHRSIAGDRYKQAEDAFRFSAQSKRSASFVETFTIQFTQITTNSCYLKLSWENTSIKFKIEFDVDAQVNKQIAEFEKSPEGMSDRNYFRAAEYYYHNKYKTEDLDQAIKWVKQAIEKSPKNFRYGLLHAKILEKKGNRTEAIKVIREANAWAKERNNANYIEQTQIFWDSIAGVTKENDTPEKVEQIRKIYNEISSKIEATEKDKESGKTSSLAVNELIVNKLDKSWAAVGNYRVTYRFYYKNRDEEPYPNQLVKVTKTTESAARKYYEEFVYDETEALIFYFEKSEDDETPKEVRIYYDQENCIRIIEDSATRDELSTNDKQYVSKGLVSSEKIEQVFRNSID